MEELIRFFLAAALVSLFVPRFMTWCGLLEKERMIKFYKSVGAIPRGQKG